MLASEQDIHLDVVADSDERNALVHAVIFTVEDHLPLDLARTRSLAGDGELQLLGVGRSAYGEIAVYLVRVRSGGDKLR